VKAGKARQAGKEAKSEKLKARNQARGDRLRGRQNNWQAGWLASKQAGKYALHVTPYAFMTRVPVKNLTQYNFKKREL
jgi:hypothetical protein